MDVFGLTVRQMWNHPNLALNLTDLFGLLHGLNQYVIKRACWPSL